MIRILALAALLVAPAVQAQRVGWRPLELGIDLIQAVDSVRIEASWTTRNNFVSHYPWRIPELGLSGDTDSMHVTIYVPQPDDDVDAGFCVKTVRYSDAKESVESCATFTIPGVDVLPPDSLSVTVEIALAELSAPSHLAVARLTWDTVPGALQYYATVETVGGLAGFFPWNVYQRDAHCVGQADHRPTGELNYEGLEIIDVFTWDSCMVLIGHTVAQGEAVRGVVQTDNGAIGRSEWATVM